MTDHRGSVPLREVIEHLIIQAWSDETPTAELAQMDDLMARINRERDEAMAFERIRLRAAVERLPMTTVAGSKWHSVIMRMDVLDMLR